MKELKNEKPHLKLHLLMGFDSILGFQEWFKAKELLSILEKIFVVSRKETNLQQQQIKNTYKEKIFYLGNHQFEHLSSTQIRKSIIKE